MLSPGRGTGRAARRAPGTSGFGGQSRGGPYRRDRPPVKIDTCRGETASIPVADPEPGKRVVLYGWP